MTRNTQNDNFASFVAVQALIVEVQNNMMLCLSKGETNE